MFVREAKGGEGNIGEGGGDRGRDRGVGEVPLGAAEGAERARVTRRERGKEREAENASSRYRI